MGGNINQYLSNLNLLNIDKITFRIHKCVLEDYNKNLIFELFDDFKPQKVEIFNIHNLAKRKYDILNQNRYFKEVSDEVVDDFYFKLNSICNCKIIDM